MPSSSSFYWMAWSVRGKRSSSEKREGSWEWKEGNMHAKKRRYLHLKFQSPSECSNVFQSREEERKLLFWRLLFYFSQSLSTFRMVVHLLPFFTSCHRYLLLLHFSVGVLNRLLLLLSSLSLFPSKWQEVLDELMTHVSRWCSCCVFHLVSSLPITALVLESCCFKPLPHSPVNFCTCISLREDEILWLNFLL